MARKSRKPERQGKPVTVRIPITVAVGYVRLSVEDRGAKGTSIETQKHIIQRYVEQHPDFQLTKLYVDDGISGATYDRPGFSEMIADAKAGKFSCILVKDASRLGRNLIDTGYYVEKMLPSIGVRLISITDGYDSARDGIDIKFTLRNLVNEAYPLDIGRKVKSVQRNQMQEGKYIGSRAPFGYLKSPEDKHKLVVDETAAPVVRQIFQWAADGKNTSEIVRSLNCAGVLTPSHYWFQQGVIQSVELLGGKHWQTRTVRKILTNEIYAGTMVQGKTKTIHHRQVHVPPEEWIRVEGTHPAIIPQELFAQVQWKLSSSTRERPAQQKQRYTPNLFKGIIFCGHCGRRMDRKKIRQRYIYCCTANYTTPGSCTGNCIHEGSLKTAAANAIREYAQSMNKARDNEDTKLIEAELAKLQVESSYDENAPISLYEALVMKKITEQEFRDYKTLYEHRAKQHRELWVQLSGQKAEQVAAADERRKVRVALEEFSRTQVLTQGLVESLIERVEVFGKGRVFVGVKM